MSTLSIVRHVNENAKVDKKDTVRYPSDPNNLGTFSANIVSSPYKLRVVHVQ